MDPTDKTGEAEATPVFAVAPGGPGTRRDELRTLLARVPTGVAVVTVDTGSQRLGLTVGTVVGLSLEPALVGFSVSRQAALHELLREAGGCAISFLAAGQEAIAEHFARGVPPIGMWQGIETEPGADGPPRITGALGWLDCALAGEIAVGTHTFFVCTVWRVEYGTDGPALVRVRGGFASA